MILNAFHTYSPSDKLPEGQCLQSGFGLCCCNVETVVTMHLFVFQHLLLVTCFDWFMA